MRRPPFVLLASLFVASAANAQSTSIEKCTGNFEEAQLKEKRGKLVEAEQLYAACADAKCPAMIRADCSAKRDEVLRRIPTITIVVRNAAGSDLESYVEIDGKPIADRAHAQAIDPGEHVINYRAQGMKPATQKITVVEGEKARVISITATEGKASEPNVPPPQTRPSESPQESHSLVAPLIVGGIGVVALIAGVGAQMLAVSEDRKREDLEADRERALVDGEPAFVVSEIEQASRTRREAAENNQLVAVVLGATGLVFIATGVVLYFVTKPSPSSKSRAAFAPAFAPGFVGASYGLRF